MKGWKEIVHANSNQKGTGTVIVLDNIDLKSQIFTRDPESRKRYTKWKKPEITGHILFYLYDKFRLSKPVETESRLVTEGRGE